MSEQTWKLTHRVISSLTGVGQITSTMKSWTERRRPFHFCAAGTSQCVGKSDTNGLNGRNCSRMTLILIQQRLIAARGFGTKVVAVVVAVVVGAVVVTVVDVAVVDVAVAAVNNHDDFDPNRTEIRHESVIFNCQRQPVEAIPSGREPVSRNFMDP